MNLIKLFQKERKPSIRRCPVCKEYPKWDCWEVIPDECIELWALRCEGQGLHYFSTSYWSNKQDTIFQWNRICDDAKQKIQKI